MEKMAKISKFKDKVKKIKRTANVTFTTDEGEFIDFKIVSRSEQVIDDVNSKYEALLPKVPTKRLASTNGKPRIVEDPENADYKVALAKVKKKNFAELALIFLADEERPEGTVGEQLAEIAEVELAGFIPKIVQRGLEISAVIEEEDAYNEELAEAKND
jgi:hypothetical protein